MVRLVTGVTPTLAVVNSTVVQWSHIQTFTLLAQKDWPSTWHTVRRKYLEGENIGEFGEFVAIRQIFTLQMS